MRFDGELYDSAGPAFAPSVVNTSHEIAEGQRLFPGMVFPLQDLIHFHDTVYRRIHWLLLL